MDAFPCCFGMKVLTVQQQGQRGSVLAAEEGGEDLG